MSTNAVEEILSGIDLEALAGQLGSDPDEVRQAAEVAIPTLLSSLQANAADPEGQQSLLGALGQHTGEITDLNAVDTEDGRRILSHVFADDPRRIQPLAGQSGGLLSKLLPLLAPLVLSWLAKKVLGGGGAATQGSGGGGLGDLLGGLLGGGGASAGGGLGDLLGQVLGGALGGSQQAPAQPDHPGFPGGGHTTPGQWPVPGDPATPQAPQTQQQSSGDVLGDLLGQILGRR